MNLGIRILSLEYTYRLCPQIWENTLSSGHRVQALSLKDVICIHKTHICTIHIHGISFKRITRNCISNYLPCKSALGNRRTKALTLYSKAMITQIFKQYFNMFKRIEVGTKSQKKNTHTLKKPH